MAKTIDLLLGSDHRGAELKQEIMDWVLLDKTEIEFEESDNSLCDVNP